MKSSIAYGFDGRFTAAADDGAASFAGGAEVGAVLQAARPRMPTRVSRVDAARAGVIAGTPMRGVA